MSKLELTQNKQLYRRTHERFKGHFSSNDVRITELMGRAFVKTPKSERQWERSFPPPFLYSTLSLLTANHPPPIRRPPSHLQPCLLSSGCLRALLGSHSRRDHWSNSMRAQCFTPASQVTVSSSSIPQSRWSNLHHWADELHISGLRGSKFTNWPITDWDLL